MLSNGNILEQKVTNADAEKIVGTWIEQEYQETDIFYPSGRVHWGDTGRVIIESKMDIYTSILMVL